MNGIIGSLGTLSFPFLIVTVEPVILKRIFIKNILNL
jgi:hypothetical protein